MMRSAHRQASAPVRSFSLTLLACALAPAAHAAFIEDSSATLLLRNAAVALADRFKSAATAATGAAY